MYFWRPCMMKTVRDPASLHVSPISRHAPSAGAAAQVNSTRTARSYLAQRFDARVGLARQRRMGQRPRLLFDGLVVELCFGSIV